jgi:hypothetical protein
LSIFYLLKSISLKKILSVFHKEEETRNNFESRKRKNIKTSRDWESVLAKRLTQNLR